MANNYPDPALVARIRSMPEEFKFAFLCLETATHASTTGLENRRWNSYYTSPEVCPYFTESVRVSLLKLAVDTTLYAHMVYASWFAENRVTGHLAKTLMDIMVAYYVRRLFTPLNFLKHVALMAELAALCFMVGLEDIPDYTIGCVVYIVKVCVDRRCMDWTAVLREAEKFAVGVENTDGYCQSLRDSRADLLRDYFHRE